MNLSALIHSLVSDTVSSTAAFRPELVLCATIVFILLLRTIHWTQRIDAFYVTLVGSAVALYLAGPWHPIDKPSEIFTGLLIYDSFTVYFRTLLLFFVVLFTIFTRISGVPDRDAAPDVYALVLGATLGMCIMASSNHLLMVFLGVEMASVPSYALAGILKGRRQSSEAALKYAVYGAGTAGVMLYGISLLAGVLGSVHIPTMAVRLSQLLAPENLEHAALADTHMVLALGALMVLVGIAFKLSAVPFHFWCPDVFEGASAEVNAFLSVASKAAALALLARVAIGFSYIPAPLVPVGQTAMFNVAEQSAGQSVEFTPAAAEGATSATIPVDRASANEALAPSRKFLADVLAFLAIITATFGNMAAYGQTNIKRLLAYSTIAQAGYMIMPLPAAMVLAGSDPEAASGALGAMAFYAGIYLFMNLGAFAVVAFLRNTMHSEQIADYAGLIRRAPLVAICFSVMLVSLIGLPPLAGFVGKLLIFYYLVQAKLWTVLVVAGLNTAISLYYYLRVVKIMTIDPEPEDRRPAEMPFIPGTYVVLVTMPILV
ncbi:MAG TPA: NADH-quinone oxidoreductase subunit N, partial [Pirellulales bacterium]|nr:NADH-quinone oxidoreductase subunit N [Pirellulales bacterium]